MLQVMTNIGIIAAGLVGLGVIWTQGIKPFYRFLRRFEEITDYILVDLPAWQQKVDQGLKQLYPNSGSSIHDKVMGTNESVAEIRSMLETHINDRSVHNHDTPATQVQINMNPGDTDR